VGCVQDTTPWVMVKEDKEQCGALVNACAGLCVLLAALVEPYMPSITRKVTLALLIGLQFAWSSGFPITHPENLKVSASAWVAADAGAAELGT
jgi:methionyl-tRNA synthetase